MKRLFLTGVVGETITRDKTEFLFSELEDGEPVEIVLSSGGGSVQEGWNVYNFLREQKQNHEIHMIGSSIVASMASIILLGGHTASVYPGTMVMIHNVSGEAYGTATEMRKTADLMELHEDELLRVYQDKSQRITQELLDQEFWMNPTKCMEYGLIDRIEDSEAPEIKVMAMFTNELDFKNIPDSVKNEYGLDMIKNEEKKDEEQVETVVNEGDETDAPENTEPENTDDDVQPDSDGSDDSEQVAEKEETEEPTQYEVVSKIKADGIAEGIAQERSRVAQIKAMGHSTQSELMNKLIENGDSVSDSMIELMNDLKSKLDDIEPKAETTTVSDFFEGSAVAMAPDGEVIDHRAVFDSLQGRDRAKYFNEHKAFLIK